MSQFRNFSMKFGKKIGKIYGTKYGQLLYCINYTIYNI